MESDPFELLDEAIRRDGPAAALERLVQALEARQDLPRLFEALLMKRRFELGLPVEGTDSVDVIPESLQREVEDAYVETCHRVGGLFLERGDIPGAWPYFRAVDEPERMREAIEAWRPPEPAAPEPAPASDDDRAGESEAGPTDEGAEWDPGEPDPVAEAVQKIVEIAFHQGAHPRRGFELVLEHEGLCRAITLFEHQFPHPRAVREECGRAIVRALWEELRGALRAEVERRGESAPPAAGVRELFEGRPWLFEGGTTHADLSHLQSAIRIASRVGGDAETALAVQLCDYGRSLLRQTHARDRAPFGDLYDDHRIFLRATLGEGTDGAVRFFRSRAEEAKPDSDGSHFPGEVLVTLLWRSGRLREAIEAHLELLREAPAPLAMAPSLLDLCQEAGDWAPALEAARARDDLLGYATALVKREPAEGPSGETPARGDDSGGGSAPLSGADGAT